MIELSADAQQASRSRVLATGLGAYASLLTFWLIAHWRESARVGVICDWAPLPADLAAILAIWVLLHSGSAPEGRWRTGWWLVMCAVVVNLAANALWINVDAATPVRRMFADCLYQIYYPLMTGALAAFFLSGGGSFRRPRIWLDAVTVMAGMLAILWTFLYQQPILGGVYHGMSHATKLIYTAGIAAAATMAILLFMQIGKRRARRGEVLLTAAVSIGLVVDTAWLAGDVGGSPVLGVIYDMGDAVFEILINMGDVVFCALIAFAAAAERHASGEYAQHGLRLQVRSQGRALGSGDLDPRVTELLRRSAELIIVIDDRGMLGFVSPAAQRVLGVPAADLQGTPAVRLLGAGHEPALTVFFAELEDGHAAEMEARVTMPGMDRRTLQIVGSDQRANHLIGGFTLSLRDVTEQRSLERELLDVAARERRRLCDEVHEGLSQDLAGISLLLRSASTSTGPDAGSLQSSLQDIIVHLNGAIGALAVLAVRLSPLQVVRGSLTAALTRLAADVSPRLPASVRFDASLEEGRIEEGAADHLYRIVQDLLAQALRDDLCTGVNVSLRTDRSQLTLAFTDSSPSRQQDRAWRRSLGFRLAGYRARVLGGAVRLESLPDGDSRIVITVPLQAAQDRRL